MKILSVEELNLLDQICKKHGVEPEHLRELLQLEHAFSLKTSARKARLKSTIKEKVQQWTQELDEEDI